jgi:hypothetical protein
MKRWMLVAAVMIGACTSSSSETTVTVTLPPPTTTTTTTTTIPPTTAATVGASLADVVAGVQAELQAQFELTGPPPGVDGPFVVTCPDAESTPARSGDVFACVGVPQADIELDEPGVVLVVVADDGTARWIAGTDLPSDASSLTALWEQEAGLHFCRELAEEGGALFSVGYTGAVAYWFLEGRPERMDADLDGVPCETVFPHDELAAFWSGLPEESALDDPGDARDFGYMTEVAADGSAITIDFAEFLSGEAAVAAAREAGAIGPDEDLPNDYFISNVNPELRTFVVDPDATVELIGFFLEGGRLETIGVTPAQWAGLYNRVAECAEDCAVGEIGLAGWQWYGIGALPYWILVEDEVVVSIEEQYLP